MSRLASSSDVSTVHVFGGLVITSRTFMVFSCVLTREAAKPAPTTGRPQHDAGREMGAKRRVQLLWAAGFSVACERFHTWRKHVA
jgi:hypothetical protein